MPNTFPFYDAEPYWPKGGYGHHGGEEGSGGAMTTDFYIFVNSFDTAAPNLAFGNDCDNVTSLEYEQMTVEVSPGKGGAGTSTQYCYRYKDCPVGAQIFNGESVPPKLSYNQELRKPLLPGSMSSSDPLYCPRPVDGLYIAAYFLDMTWS